MTTHSHPARPFGAPRAPQVEVDHLAFHLHRYLTPFLDAQGLDALELLVGFDGSSAPCVRVHLTLTRAEGACCQRDFSALARRCRRADRDASAGLPEVCDARDEAGGHTVALVPVASLDDDEPEQVLAFACLPPDAPLLGDAAALDALRRPGAAEAVRSARHNALRLFFDGAPERPIKPLLYDLLDRLPAWCGVDHSAALILTANLEAMTLDAASEATFEIIAERVYLDPDPDDPASRERLVGLVIDGAGPRSGLLGHAFARVQETRQVGLFIFAPDGDETRDVWHLFAEPEQQVTRFATRSQRPAEGMTVLIPLLSRDERDAPELLGFLSLNYHAPAPITGLTSRVLEALAGRLASLLRHSSLFTLSARQLLILEQARAAHDPARHGPHARAAIPAFIARVNALLIEATGVPCAAVGHLDPDADAANQRLRFTGAQGFTQAGDLELPLHPADVHASGLAALAVRLQRPFALSGGGHPAPAHDPDRAAHAFKNDVFVDETSGQIVDARMLDPRDVNPDADWRRLRDYYRPIREASYATLAFPITLGDHPLGALVVEVDRDTDWFWWTGFGSQIFYRLLANELAVALRLMGL